MTQEEIGLIKGMEGTPGFRAMQVLMENKIRDLDSVSQITETTADSAGVQALAHKKAVKLLREFLDQIKFVNNQSTNTNKTYE